MNFNERLVVSLILLGIAALVSLDIYQDFGEGVVLWHLVVESSVAVLALIGVFYLLRGSLNLRHRLETAKLDQLKLKSEAEAWRLESKKHVEGLSRAIDLQLEKWNLTGAEREVAFLLLKGLSLKEIAEVRKTTEKTARVQSMSIYSKAGLAGRSELSAFFLEDLLAPKTD